MGMCDLAAAHQSGDYPYFKNPILVDDLRHTTEALYARMENSEFGSEDVYWASLPVHLRNFIRNSLPLTGNLPPSGHGPGTLPGGVHAAGGQMAMYQMAQQIFEAANIGGSPTGTPMKTYRTAEASGYQRHGFENASSADMGVTEHTEGKSVRSGVVSTINDNANL